jgi:hypothetical protein
MYFWLRLRLRNIPLTSGIVGKNGNANREQYIGDDDRPDYRITSQTRLQHTHTPPSPKTKHRPPKELLDLLAKSLRRHNADRSVSAIAEHYRHITFVEL